MEVRIQSALQISWEELFLETNEFLNVSIQLKSTTTTSRKKILNEYKLTLETQFMFMMTLKLGCDDFKCSVCHKVNTWLNKDWNLI